MDEIELYPPNERSRVEEKLKSKDLILYTIKEQKATYPSEIAMLTGLSDKTVYRTLARLCYLNKIKRVTLKKSLKNTPRFIKERIPELWERDIKGGQIMNLVFYLIPDNKLKEVNEEISNAFDEG